MDKSLLAVKQVLRYKYCQFAITIIGTVRQSGDAKVLVCILAALVCNFIYFLV